MLGAVTATPDVGAADGTLSLTPVRRTTIATADMEASLRFYRDLLGFSVEYDVAVTDRAQLDLFDPTATRGRAVALKQERLGGSIGLFWTPDQASPGACPAHAEPGAVSLLLLTDNLRALEQRFRDAGVTFLAATEYAASRGRTRAFTVFDPNCVRVAVAEIEDETLEQSLSR